MSLKFLKKKFYGKSMVAIAEEAIEKISKEPSWTLTTHGVSQGMLMEFLACKERARLGYIEGWTSQSTSNAIVFGQLFHSALESLYKHMKIGGAINGPDFVQNVAKTVLDIHKKEISGERIWTVEDENEHLINSGYLYILLPEYVKKYWEKDSKHEWLIVEDAFQNKFSFMGGDESKDPEILKRSSQLVNLKGRYDQVYRNANGEVWLKEVKTKSRFDPSIQDKLPFDLQVMFYLLNYRLEFNVMPTGFVYDMIQRPALRKGKNENLKHFMDRVKSDVDATYFKRIRMRVTSAELDAWIQTDFVPLLQEFVAWADGKSPSYRNPASCETRYGTCKYLRVCGVNDFGGLVRKSHSLLEEKIV